MNKLWLRLGAGLLACLVVIGAAVWMTNRTNNGKRTDGLFYAASGIHPDAKLLTVDGKTVEGEEYLYWLAYGCEYLVSNLGEVDWNASLTDDMTYGDYAKTDALETVKLFSVIHQLADEKGITLTEEDLAQLQQQKDSYAAYYGGAENYSRQIQLMGISEEAYDRINSTYLLLDRLTKEATQEGGSLYPAQEDLLSYGEEHGYVTTRALYLPTIGLDEEAVESQRVLAESYVQRLRELDSDGAYELLGQLADELGMDVTDQDYTLSPETSNETLVQAIAALDEGAVSDVITTDNGLYVAMRRPLNISALAQNYFTDHLMERRQACQVTFSKLYGQLDAGTFYENLLQQRTDLAQQFAAEE